MQDLSRLAEETKVKVAQFKTADDDTGRRSPRRAEE
jgi:hypothetical protein